MQPTSETFLRAAEALRWWRTALPCTYFHPSQPVPVEANKARRSDFLPEAPVCRLPDATENALTRDVMSVPKVSAQSAGRL
jgi:hypothetical protein